MLLPSSLILDTNSSFFLLPSTFHVLLRTFEDGRQPPPLCCQKGKGRPWPLSASPDPRLPDVVGGGAAQSKSFLTNIRLVNTAVSFTSAGFGIGLPLNQLRFAGSPPTFVIQGTFHHNISSPLPWVEQRHEGSDLWVQPRYAEIYFYSAEEEQINYMLDNFEELNTSFLMETMTANQGLLLRINHYVGIYRSVIEAYRLIEAAARATAKNPHADSMRVSLRTHNTSDPRRYNNPFPR